MSNATFHFPKHRIATLMRAPGGKKVSDAVKDAEARLADIAAACLEGADAGLERISALAADLAVEPRREHAQALYDEANRLVGLGAVGGAPELDRIAYSLCEMLDAMMREGVVDQPSVAVHVRSLHLVRNPAVAANPAAMTEVLGGLEKVRTQFSERAQAPARPGRQTLI